MYFRNKLSITILFIGLLGAQSVFNAYGLGMSISTHHTASAGAGSIGLVPSFYPGVSLDNPATWPGLNFSYVSGSYGNRSIGIGKNGNRNYGNGFDKIQFVIPIKNRFAIGLSLKPVNDHNAYFKTDSTRMNFQGRDIIFNKEFRSGGGILAGSFGISLPMNDRMGFGLSFDRLFGSSRDEETLILDSVHYRLFNIKTYSGSTFSLNFAGKFYDERDIMVTGYARISMTGEPISGTQYQFDLFEDKNDNYSFDTDDYPATIGVDTIDVSNIYAPSSFSIGLNAGFKNDLNIFGEFQLWNDQATNGNYSSIYTDQIGSKTHLGGGVIKFGKMGARSWQDRITMRLGTFKESYVLKNSGRKINENGISVGIGFKFAATGNQLDIAYRTGSRFMTKDYKESIQEFTIGLSLGDIWFLRRRAKQ
ncbi:MAG: hypothetical protein ISR82_02370 [Candidatus Marinimicrobia bacterium]|nr:hypothetical protein [Candidatus Neomarinimicrobiota bacterium]MBL7010052.1 hypothetical protein [Candidatus Neomarinimicrobiota bacterium]MBL7030321.1 hypothetical protein [Candidatus Neomarinimicrobiota bacterium]